MSEYLILKRCLTSFRDLQADRIGFAVGRPRITLDRRKIAVRIVPHILVHLASPGDDRFLYIFVAYLFFRREIAVCLALRQQLPGCFPVLVGVIGLEDNLFFVIESDPGEPIEDRSGRLLSRPGEIGVLDPKKELPTGLFGVQIIVKRGSSRTDRSEEHTSELQSQSNLVCRLLL